MTDDNDDRVRTLLRAHRDILGVVEGLDDDDDQDDYEADLDEANDDVGEADDEEWAEPDPLDDI